MNIEQDIGNSSFFGYDITPSIRFYANKPSKSGPQGFFIAPFFRYANYAFRTNEDFSLFIRGNVAQGKWRLAYTAPFLGVMLGTQTIKQSRFVWSWHLGLGVGPAKAKVSAKNIRDYDLSDYQSLEEEFIRFWTEIDGVETTNVKSSFDNKSAIAQINFLSATFPVGVSLGYNF